MRHELRSYAWKTLGYFLVLEFLIAAAIVFWPSFEENVDALRSFIPTAEGQKMFDAIAESGVSAYVVLQHFFKGCNTLGGAAAVFLAMSAVAGEAHRGTLEIWLARPLSRRRILLERYTLGALGVVLPVWASSLTIPWLLDLVHEEMSWRTLLLCSAHESVFLLALYSLVFLCSCVGDKPVRIAFAWLGFLTAQFALYLVKYLTHASIFRLSDLDVHTRIGSMHTLDWRLVVPLLLTSAVALVLSVRAFERRVP